MRCEPGRQTPAETGDRPVSVMGGKTSDPELMVREGELAFDLAMLMKSDHWAGPRLDVWACRICRMVVLSAEMTEGPVCGCGLPLVRVEP